MLPHNTPHACGVLYFSRSMTFEDVHVLVAIKLLFLVFLAGAFFCARKKTPPWVFLIFFGILSAASYILFVDDTALLFWGLQGDEITIAAMYNTFAHVGLGSDFAFHGFPAFYPALYFWIFAIPGRILEWNGVQIAKLGAATGFLLFPLAIYSLRALLPKSLRKKHLLTVFAFLAPLILMSTLGIDLFIGKPYEIIAAAVAIFWTICLHKRAQEGALTKKEIALFGIIAGLVFMTYYLWLVFAGLVYIIQMFVIERKILLRYLANLTKVAVVGIITALPFITPLILAYVANGMESWQTTFYTPVSSELWLPLTEFGSLTNIVLFAGFASILWFYKELIPRILLSFLGAAFLWWGFGLSMLLFFSTPFQEFRGFYVLAPTALALGAAYGGAKLWMYLKEQKNHNAQRVLLIIAVLMLGAQSIFGLFLDDPVVQQNRLASKHTNKDIHSLAQALEEVPHASTLTTLHTVPQLPAFVPINHYLYFNQHNTHPAAIFSTRYETVLSLASATTSEQIYAIASNAPYGPIDQFIFFDREDTYELYYHLDKPIVGIEQKTISLQKSLFSDEFFDLLYDEGAFVVLHRLPEKVAK